MGQSYLLDGAADHQSQYAEHIEVVLFQRLHLGDAVHINDAENLVTGCQRRTQCGLDAHLNDAVCGGESIHIAGVADQHRQSLVDDLLGDGARQLHRFLIQQTLAAFLGDGLKLSIIIEKADEAAVHGQGTERQFEGSLRHFLQVRTGEQCFRRILEQLEGDPQLFRGRRLHIAFVEIGLPVVDHQRVEDSLLGQVLIHTDRLGPGVGVLHKEGNSTETENQAIAKGDPLHSFFTQMNAVATAGVDEDRCTVLPDDAGVLARDGLIVDADIRGIGATEGHLTIEDLFLLIPAGVAKSQKEGVIHGFRPSWSSIVGDGPTGVNPSKGLRRTPILRFPCTEGGQFVRF